MIISNVRATGLFKLEAEDELKRGKYFLLQAVIASVPTHYTKLFQNNNCFKKRMCVCSLFHARLGHHLMLGINNVVRKRQFDVPYSVLKSL